MAVETPALPASIDQKSGISPWFIAITITFATFMELLDTAIANVSSFGSSSTNAAPALIVCSSLDDIFHLRTRVATLSKSCSGCRCEFVLTAMRIRSICSDPACRLSSQSKRAKKKESGMFKRILVAHDESPEFQRALLTGIHLAKSLNTELRAVSVQEKLRPYTGYIDAEVPAGGTPLLRHQASDYYRDLQAHTRETAQQEDAILTTELVEGDEVQAIVECVRETQSDMLVVGLHSDSLLYGRLWNHTTHDLVQQLSTSILGVH
jgi:nucleotide-binding universal stress UspA family protein